MSEFITIQIGQCGNQIGASLWPKILQEYEISFTGDDNKYSKKNSNINRQQYLSSFFHCFNKAEDYNTVDELIKNNVKTRAICIDMEDSVVSRFKTGRLRGLFDNKCLITNYPGSGNNWAEGFWEHGAKYEEKIYETIQYCLERSDCVHGFLLIMSTGGGTGSGLGSYILQMLTDNYTEIEKFSSCIYPIGTEDVITCPYNMAFCTEILLNNASCAFPVENRSLFRLLSRQTNRFYLENDILPSFESFEDLNSIIVKMLLNMTSGSRFSGSLNMDMNDLNTNLIPFPDFNFISSGLSPLFSLKNSKENSKQLKEEIFMSSCHRNNQLLKLDPLHPQSFVLSSTLLSRGEFSITELRSFVEKLKIKGNFTPWSKKALRIGHCHVPSTENNLSILSLFNTTSMQNLFNNILNQFTRLYKKKAHVHHYTSVKGFDEDSFGECQEKLENIIYNYKQFEKSNYF